jgi:hypothetical protein
MLTREALEDNKDLLKISYMHAVVTGGINICK